MGSYDPQPGNSERQDVGGAIASQIGPLADQIKEKVSNVADRASGALSDAKDRGSEAADNAGEVMGALRDAVTAGGARSTGRDRAPVDRRGLPARRDVEIWTLEQAFEKVDRLFR